MKKAKPIYVWPGDTRDFDGTQPLIYIGPAITLAVIAFLFLTALTFIATWWDIPYFPVPTNNRSAGFHLWAMVQVFIGLLIPSFQGDTYRLYAKTIIWWSEHGESQYLFIRWFLSVSAGLAGAYFAARVSLVPVEQSKQVRGKELLTDKEGFEDLKAVMDEQIKYDTPSYILATKKGFMVNKPETYQNENEVLRISDAQRRGTSIYVAGSRRGKGVTLKKLIMQLYYHEIVKGLNTKLFIIDTPKGEYAQLLSPKDFIQVNLDEKNMTRHGIGRDLLLPQYVAQFVSGLIPVSEKDPFWGNSGRIVATGIGSYLCTEANGDWGYSNFTYFKDLPPSELKVLLEKYYPEANQILSMGEQPLSSVIGQVASSLGFMNDVARIWEGYDYKKDIHQMSTKLLKREFWLNWFLDRAFNTDLTESEQEKEEELNKVLKDLKAMVSLGIGMTQDELENNKEKITYVESKLHELKNSKNPRLATRYILRAHIETLNTKESWKWIELRELLEQPWPEQVKVAKLYAKSSDSICFTESNIDGFSELVMPIIKWAKIWDAYESRPSFSLREWLLDENPAKKIVLLKPSGRFKTQLEGIIRGLLLFMTSNINDKFFPDDKTKEVALRNFHIVCDEFNSLGNLKEFIEPAMAMFASKGISIHVCIQDFSQLKDTYTDNFLKFVLTNSANIYIIGMNSGESAEMVSNMIGKKHMSKLHRSKTSQEGGSSTSVNYQVHDNEAVITPDEINSMLGKKGNAVRVLYLPGTVTNSYIYNVYTEDYPILYTPKPADWIVGKTYSPSRITLKDFKSKLTPESLAVTDVVSKPVHLAKATPQPKAIPKVVPKPSQANNHLIDAANEIDDSYREEEIEALAALEDARNRSIGNSKYLDSWKKKQQSKAA